MTKTVHERCSECRLIVHDCICPELTPIWTEHKITLLTSRKETRIPSNTGRLIRLMLKNTTTIFIGEKGWEKEVEAEIARIDYTPVILFPMFSSFDEQNNMKETGKPLNIFAFDTNWKSARKWLHKPILRNVKKIGLKEIPPSEYRLRKESSKNNLCTFQAAIALLKEVETDSFASTYLQMTEIFKLWVQSMARERGKIIKGDNRYTTASL